MAIGQPHFCLFLKLMILLAAQNNAKGVIRKARLSKNNVMFNQVSTANQFIFDRSILKTIKPNKPNPNSQTTTEKALTKKGLALFSGGEL